MNRPPKTTAPAMSTAKTEQVAKLRQRWQALREACQAKHLNGSPGSHRGRLCACGNGIGHGEACEMLSIIRNFFLTVDLDKPKSWEYNLVDILSGVIP